MQKKVAKIKRENGQTDTYSCTRDITIDEKQSKENENGVQPLAGLMKEKNLFLVPRGKLFNILTLMYYTKMRNR